MSKAEKLEYVWSTTNNRMRVKGTQIYVHEISRNEWEAAFAPIFVNSTKASSPDMAVRKLQRRELVRKKHIDNIARSKRRLDALL